VRNTDITGQAELFLYLADRAQHVATLIRPALEAGKCVLSDRFADSTVAYQGYGRGLDPGLLHTLNQVAVNDTWPDLTILLDIEPEVGLKRALTRNIQDNTYESEGRFEAESLAFHSRVREGYQTWAALNTDRVRMVDATPGPEQVFEGVRRAVDVFMERTQAPGPS
jgi:dTMP kinase